MTDHQRDAETPLHVFVPVDASRGNPYDFGSGISLRGGFFVRTDEAGYPVVDRTSAGRFEPRNWRMSDLGEKDPHGADDRRLELQSIVDYDGPRDVAAGGAWGQPEFTTPRNRSTRYVDLSNRVAIGPTHMRIVGSEDNRYALALTMREVPIKTTGDDAAEARERIPTQDPTAGRTATQDPTSQAGPPGQTQTRGDVDVTTRTRGGDDDGTTVGIGPDYPAGYVQDTLTGAVGLLGTVFFPSLGGRLFTGREKTKIGILPIRADAQFVMNASAIGRVLFMDVDCANFPEDGEPHKGWMMKDTTRANIDSALGHETCQWRPVVPVTAAIIKKEDPPPFLPPEETILDPPPARERTRTPGPGEGSGRTATGDPTGGGGETIGDPPPVPPRGGTGVGTGTGAGTTTGPGTGTGTGTGPGTGPGTGTGTGTGPGSGGGGSGTGTGIGHVGQEWWQTVTDPVPDAQSQARDFEGGGVPCPNATSGVAHKTLEGGTVDGEPVTTGHPGVTVRDGAIIIGGVHHLAAPPAVNLTPMPPAGTVIDTLGHVRQPTAAEIALLTTGTGLSGSAGGSFVAVSRPIPPLLSTIEQGQFLLGQLDPNGDPFLDELGNAITPRDFDPENDTRVPVDELPPISSFPPGRQAIVRAKRENRARNEARENRQRETAAQREDREARDAAQRDQDYINEAKRQRDALPPGHPQREALNNAIVRRAQARERRQERESRQRQRRERQERERQERRRRREERRQRQRERNRRRREQRAQNPPPHGGYVIDVTDPSDPFVPAPFDPRTGTFGGVGSNLTDEQRAAAEEELGRTRVQSQARFGDYNAANFPLPLWGEVGSPRTLEGYTRLHGVVTQALQRVVLGAFGGPEYLAGNIGVQHVNTPGNPPVPSRIGARWTARPGRQIVIERGQDVFQVRSALVADEGGSIHAKSGGILEVLRVHEGKGAIRDDRPLILADNGPSTTADILATPTRWASINADEGFQATAGYFVQPAGGGGGRAFSVGQAADPATYQADTIGAGGLSSTGGASDILEGEFAYIDMESPSLNSNYGFSAVDGHVVVERGSIFVDDQGVIAALGPGTHSSTSGGGTDTSLAFAALGSGTVLMGDLYGNFDLNTLHQGDLTLYNPVSGAASKLTVDMIDPRSIVFDELAAAPAEFTASATGLMAKTDHLPYWWDRTTLKQLLRTGDAGTGTNALLDGTNHTDTLAGTVVRGDMVYGNSTPKWARKALGTVGKVVSSDGTDLDWLEAPHQYCAYPSRCYDVPGTPSAPTSLWRGVYAWGSFGLTYISNAGASGPTTDSDAYGFESDNSRQGSYVSVTFGSDDGDAGFSFATGVPSGFNAWRTTGLAVRTKVTGVAAAGATIRISLVAYNPSSGATSSSTRDITTDDTDYVETTITPPGTWQGGDLLRFDVTFTKQAAGDGDPITVKVGRLRAEWR